MKQYALAPNFDVFKSALKRSKWDATQLMSGQYLAAIEYGDYSERDALAAAGATLLPATEDPHTPIGVKVAAACGANSSDTTFQAAAKVYAATGWPPFNPVRPLT